MERIKNDIDYHSALTKIEAFIAKGFSQLSLKETKQLETLSIEIEHFEKEKFGDIGV